DGTAKTGDSDYTAVTGQVVTFLAGETSHTVQVQTTADNKVEADETFTASLGGLNTTGRSVTIGSPSSATGTITNDDSAQFSITGGSATEGGAVTFTITLSNQVDVYPSTTLIPSDGTAKTGDSDYTAVT